MTQNIISLNITDADLTAVDEALAILDQKLAAPRQFVGPQRPAAYGAPKT